MKKSKKRRADRKTPKNGDGEKQRQGDRDAWRDKGNRERAKGERKEVGRVVEEGGGGRGEEKALVMPCDLG